MRDIFYLSNYYIRTTVCMVNIELFLCYFISIFITHWIILLPIPLIYERNCFGEWWVLIMSLTPWAVFIYLFDIMNWYYLISSLIDVIYLIIFIVERFWINIACNGMINMMWKIVKLNTNVNGDISYDFLQPLTQYYPHTMAGKQKKPINCL